MGVKFTSVKCPECGAGLPIEEGRQLMFCSYCGVKILMTNENEYIYRTIDEAGIKKAEADHEVRIKQMEIIAKKNFAKEKFKRFKVIMTVILGVVCLLSIAIGYSSNGSLSALMVGMVSGIILFSMWINNIENGDDDINYSDKIRVPSSISNYENKNYASIEAMFKSAGFTNVRCVPLNDLITGLLKKPGIVESITINGHSITSGGKKFSPDASVVISYHSFSGR